MQRKGSGAVLLILLVVVGGLYYVGQNPEIADQLQNNLDIQLPAGGGGVCSDAQQWASDQGYTPNGCLCADSASTGEGTLSWAMIELDDGRYVGAQKVSDLNQETDAIEAGRWYEVGVSSNEAAAQRSCGKMQNATDEAR